MKRLILAVALVATPVVALSVTAPFAVASHEERKPKPGKKVQELAADLAYGAMTNGAYETMDAQQLAEYCVDVAIILSRADYDPEPQPE